MQVRINGDLFLNIQEDYLIVRDNRLFNTKTGSFEAVDGDIIEFITKKGDIRLWHRGFVEGYTNGENIRLRGVFTTKYDNIIHKEIEHISKVYYSDGMTFEEKELLAATEAL